jgi:DNA-directed RNA polymerase specialized sigma24 family protein
MDGVKNRFITEVPHYLDDLYNLSLFLTCSSSKAEKLLYRVIIDAADFIKYHEPPDKYKWLIRIVLNLYNRFYLVSGKDPSESDIDLRNLPQNVDKFLIEDMFRKMRESDIFKLLSSLPTGWREVLVFKEVLNFNYELISELLDIPEGTVIVRLTQARKYIYSQIAVNQ